MCQIERGHIPTEEELLELYADADWTAYTDDPERLIRAVRRSNAVYTAWDGEKLAGLLRAVGDGETILYVQDLLVKKIYQRRGIGRALLERLEADCGYIRQRVLLTDDTPETAAFYRACGWTPVGESACVAYMKQRKG